MSAPTGARSGVRLLVDAAALHALTAVAIGLVWWAWAPRLTYTVVDGRALVVQEAGYTLIFSGDATFALLSGIAGVACAAVLLARGHRGPWVPVVVAVLGAAGAALAWWIAVTLGPGSVQALAEATDAGEVVAGPELNAYASLLVWPIVAVSTVFVATVFSEPERQRQRRSHPSAR